MASKVQLNLKLQESIKCICISADEATINIINIIIIEYFSEHRKLQLQVSRNSMKLSYRRESLCCSP